MTLKEIKSKIGKYRILSVIIVSYLVVISLFVATFFTIYFYSQKTFHSYFDYNSKVIAGNISEKYEENVEKVHTRVVNSILTNRDVQKNIREIQKGTDTWNCCSYVKKQLGIEKIGADNLVDVLIYVESKDLIIFSTGFCSAQQYYEAYASGSFSNYDEFHSFLNGEEIPQNLFSQKTMQLFSRKQYNLYNEGTVIGKIILMNDARELIRDFIDENSDVVILENEHIIVSSDEMIALDLLKSEYRNDEKFELNGKLVYRSAMSDGRRKCFYIVDMMKMKEADNAYNIFITSVSVLCLLICAIACVFFTRFHYSPIKKFVEFIRVKNMKDDYHIDYGIFSDAIDYIESNEKSAIEKIEAKERDLREVHLEQWLLYKKSSSKEVLKIGQYKNSALVVVEAEAYDQIFFEEVHEKKSVKGEMANYILSNIFDEELRNAFPDVIKCRINDLLIWLVSFEDKPEWKTEINEIAKRMQKLTAKEFNISFEYYTSDLCETMEKISEDFDLLMIEIKQKNENIHSQLFSEIDRKEKFVYYFPETLKKQLYESIEDGNSKSAVMILDNIINHNIQKMHFELNNLKALAAEIYNTVILRLSCLDIEVEKLFEENRLGKDIIMCEQTEVLEYEMKKFIESMCGIFYSRVNNSDGVYAKTRKFVYQNYKNPLLSSVIIADELGLSRDYFLSVFKKESGMKVADYIHQIRVEEACKLLEKTNLSIEKIAKQVGYSNTKTFSRTFVKLKGITPGAYRDQLG